MEAIGQPKKKLKKYANRKHPNPNRRSVKLCVYSATWSG